MTSMMLKATLAVKRKTPSASSATNNVSMKSQVRGGRTETGERTFSGSGMTRQQHRLHDRTEIVQAVQHDGEPGRVAAVADVAEPEADAEHLAEEEPVVLQMQPGPDQR